MKLFDLIDLKSDLLRGFLILFFFVFAICSASFSVMANPTGGVVAAGSASITKISPKLTVIHQGTSKVIINWQSFNIGASQKTQFIQPDARSIALNRINPAMGVSQIYGLLVSNGQIILINGAGIHFGPNAMVNVGSLIASTSDISNTNFLHGNFKFNTPSANSGSIINDGKLIASRHGLIALLGSSIQNNGMIQAEMGNIVLATGRAFTLDFYGDQLINFTVDSPVPAGGKITNTGALLADGGKVLVSAAVAENTLNDVINMQGVVQAKSVYQHKGEIIISGGETGTVTVSGKLIVSGKGSHSTGGTISVLGSNIALTSTAYLDANGASGGGTILIGGNLHGAGPQQNALTTSIASGALIEANALKQGNGGTVIVWANTLTNYFGSILAKGGVSGGNGGFVEVSGHHLLQFNGTVNLSAVSGDVGTLLLDPENLTIQTAGPSTATNSGNTYTSNTDNSILTVADLQASLTNANVLIQTGTGGLQAGDITIANDITWSDQNTLTLSAFRNISINAAISNSSGGGLTMRADNTGTGVGTVIFTGVAPQVMMSGGGAVNIFYNPASYTTPTNYSSQVNVSGGSILTSYMLVNSAINLASLSTNLAGNYALSKNISLTGNFTSIGSLSTPFTGQFNGLGHTISGLAITNTTPNTNLGLFGVATGATIENITLNSPTIVETADNTGGSIYIGTLVGLMNGGVIDNANVVNPVITATGTNYGGGSTQFYDLGGLIGAMKGGIVSHSFSSGGTLTDNVNVVSGINNYSARNEVGGLIGGVHNSAVLLNDFSTTAVTANSNVTVLGSGVGQIDISGLIGRLDTGSQLTNAYSTGAVKTTGALTVSNASGAGYIMTAGLIGNYSIGNTQPAQVSNVYSTGSVTANITATNTQGLAEVLTAGLIGQNNGTLSNAYSTGAVSASLASDPSATGVAFFVGGLTGVSLSLINNSYTTSPVTLTGNAYNGDVEVGGVVGGQVTLYDLDVTGSFSSGALKVNFNSVGGQLFVGGFAGSFVYYGNPPQLIAFNNDYSTSTVNVSGQNNGAIVDIGGFIGANGYDPVNSPGGNINNSYSTGSVVSNVVTSNAGTTRVGGFAGFEDNDTSATLTNNFWNTDTSGFNQNQGVGNIVGPVAGLTGGCVGGACLNGGTVNLSLESTYTNAGWDFITVWGITGSLSYPYLLAINYPVPPTPVPVPVVPVVPAQGDITIPVTIVTPVNTLLKSTVISAISLFNNPNYNSGNSIPSDITIGVNAGAGLDYVPESVTYDRSYETNVALSVPSAYVNDLYRYQSSFETLKAIAVQKILAFLPVDNNARDDETSYIGIILLLLILMLGDSMLSRRYLILRSNKIRLETLASALSFANTMNIKRRTKNSFEGVAIADSIDAEKLLKNSSLPFGFVISPVTIMAGTTVICVVTDLISQKTALFRITGIM